MEKLDILEIMKDDLPNFPEEVLELWLFPFAKDAGWPPSLGGRWNLLLKDISFDYLRAIVWEKVNINMEGLNFSQLSHKGLDDMYSAYINGEDNFMGRNMGQLGKDKFIATTKYMMVHGVFPKPPILIAEEEGYDIVDGNHRILSYVFLDKMSQASVDDKGNKISVKKPKVIQDIWIGKLRPAN